MHIDLGARVRTKDGHSAGDVKQAVWDPRGNQITQYVISTGSVLGHDVIVSPEMLEGATRDGSAIVLDMSKHELDELAHYEPEAYAPPPADWRAPSASGFPSSGYLWPVTDAETVLADVSPPREGSNRGPKAPKST